MSTTDALSRTAGVALVVLVVLASAAAERSWLRQRPKWTHRAAGNASDMVLPVAMWLIILGQPFLAAATALSFAIGTGIMARHDYRHREEGASLPTHRGTVILGDSPELEEISEIRVRAAIAVGVVALSVVMAVFGGWGRATLQRDALITAGGSKIVVATYGEYAILANLEIEDDGDWHIGDIRQKVGSSALDSMEFEMQQAPSLIDWR